MKVCRLCKMPKSLDVFCVDRGYVRGECKECAAAARVVARRAENLENTERRAVQRRKYQYGLSDADYRAMLAAQKGGCAVCGGPPVGGRKHLSVDHDHKTGKVRALLCEHCNIGLGHFKDSSELLQKATDYLLKFSS